MIKLFIFMSSLIFYNQDYHFFCITSSFAHFYKSRFAHIFISRRERTYFDQDSKPGGSNYGKSILSLLGGKVDL